LHALTLAYRVVVSIGSANQPRDEDNPFTQEERGEVIFESVFDAFVAAGTPLTEEQLRDRLHIVAVENQIYSNPGWALDVSNTVEPHCTGPNVRLIGHSKDETTFYLKMFPQWGDPIEMPLIEPLDATTIRSLYFSKKVNLNFFKHVIPGATQRFLEKFLNTTDYEYVMNEQEYIQNYQKQFEHLPYAPVFMTGDALVFKDNHILLIQRKNHPGKGLWAIPGGFLNAKRRFDKKKKEWVEADASMMACAIRELFEETKIGLPRAFVEGCIKEEKIFDAVKRSRRGRVITTAQIIVLPSDGRGFPKVKASDDAMDAAWIHISKIKRINMFEDHYDMIMYAINVMRKYSKVA
jgi:bifunctional NMN adenylyltransferase/nudix hydrolase